MKRLVLLRHAKAQPDAPDGDHSRRLTKRGTRDASTIGAILLEEIGIPGLIVSSDAVRARETAKRVADVLSFVDEIVLESRLYLAAGKDIAQIIRRFPNAMDCALVVGHNPGLEDLVANLAGSSNPIDHLPTAGSAIFDLNIVHWEGLSTETCQLRLVTGPHGRTTDFS
jgi:phosphohistidine phosphatase